jgi:FAD/FMN-containing dehydrogenase
MAETTGLDGERLRELTRIGAEVTLRRLRAEIIAIERAFPELKLSARRRQVRTVLREARTRTRTMSAEARRAVSERMKRYWAERRKAQARVKQLHAGLRLRDEGCVPRLSILRPPAT